MMMSSKTPYYAQEDFEIDDVGIDDKAIIEHHHHHHTVGSDHVWTAKAPAKTAKAIICRLFVSLATVAATCTLNPFELCLIGLYADAAVMLLN
jgi:ABC-type Zn2+ transport system substrate-binding protein/surface adhesin